MMSPGCTKTEGGQYRPIVVVANDGIYIYSVALTTADIAIEFSQLAIDANEYRHWHYHQLGEES